MSAIPLFTTKPRQVSTHTWPLYEVCTNSHLYTNTFENTALALVLVYTGICMCVSGGKSISFKFFIGIRHPYELKAISQNDSSKS